VMPGYPFLAGADLDFHDIAAHLKTNRAVGVPYTDAQIEQAVADLRAQANPDDPGADGFLKRWPKANVRDFDGRPDRLTEMDALVAYLQVLGTMVDFKIYDDKADLR
jgi:cytochrome c oxidase cbb3-type subunit II